MPTTMGIEVKFLVLQHYMVHLADDAALKDKQHSRQ